MKQALILIFSILETPVYITVKHKSTAESTFLKDQLASTKKENLMMVEENKEVVCAWAKWFTQPELILVSWAWSEYY